MNQITNNCDHKKRRYNEKYARVRKRANVK